MAIQTTAVVRAQCDACPQVVYADSPAEPKGYQLEAREVDGNGKIVTATAFACQPNHIGKAIQNALKQTRAGLRPQVAPQTAPAYAPTAVTFPAPPVPDELHTPTGDEPFVVTDDQDGDNNY